MGIGTKLKRIAGYGFKPHVYRNIRRKLGISARSKWLRGIKHGLKKSKGSFFAPSQPTSASDVYHYQGRTLSQLTGGV